MTDHLTDQYPNRGRDLPDAAPYACRDGGTDVGGQRYHAADCEYPTDAACRAAANVRPDGSRVAMPGWEADAAASVAADATPDDDPDPTYPAQRAAVRRVPTDTLQAVVRDPRAGRATRKAAWNELAARGLIDPALLDADGIGDGTAATCVGGHWPVAEYGTWCPSCRADALAADADRYATIDGVTPPRPDPADGIDEAAAHAWRARQARRRDRRDAGRVRRARWLDRQAKDLSGWLTPTDGYDG